MKQILMFFSVTLCLYACNYQSETGSGKIISQNKTVGNFTGISASNAIDVEVKIGSPAAVKIEADDNIIQYVVARVNGNTLKLGIENGVSINNPHIKVYVTVPELNNLSASSSSDINIVDVIKGNGKLSFDASSSGDIKAIVDAPAVYVEASSSGIVSLSGKTQNYTVKVSSSGSAQTEQLLSENTNASSSSSATAQVHSSVSLKAAASSGGTIKYNGGGTPNVSTSSGGSVSKAD